MPESRRSREYLLASWLHHRRGSKERKGSLFLLHVYPWFFSIEENLDVI